jgi:hypothetical protein
VALLGTLDDAIYSWWLHPVAVNDGDVTWVGSTGSGDPGVPERRNRVWRVGSAGVSSVLLEGTTSPDDHNAAAVAVNPAQDWLIAFYARHNNDTFTRYQFVHRGTLAAGPLLTLDFGGSVTYNQVLQLGDTIHLIVRNATADAWQYRTSTNWGDTWGATKTLVDFAGFGSSYVVAKPDPADPNTVHMAIGPHPPNTTLRSIHYGTIDLPSGQVRSHTGQVLGNLGATGGPGLPVDTFPAAVELTGTERARTLDVGVVDGQPAIAYAIWEGEAGDPTYRVRRWDGTAWMDVDWEVASGPEFGYLPNRRYLGGVVVGRGDDLFSSRLDGGAWIVEHWTWNGNGFDLDQEVDRSGIRLIRPYVPQGDGPADVVYQRVTHYSSEATNDYTGDLLVVALDPVVSEPPPPGDGEALPAGTVSPVVTWLGCDLVTGRIVADLPDVTGNISRILGQYTSTSLNLPIPLAGPGTLGDLAFQATVPGRTMVVAVVNGQPAWGGMVVRRNGGTDGGMVLSCVTPEGYLARRRVRGHTFVQVDQATIAAALAGDAGTILGVGSGIGLEVDAPASGVLRDRDYKASDRSTVYQRLQELSNVIGGPEWTVELLWGDDTHTWVRKLLRIRNRVGVASADPTAVFETTAASVFESRSGNEARYEYDEDFTDGRGANYVVAYSSGEGDDQPASAPAIAHEELAAGFPVYERHWQPSSSITSQAVLDDHAASELQLRRNGARTWKIDARWNVYPRLNIDWRIGDDVAWKLFGHRHPDGATGQGRCIGWQLDPEAGTVAPVLLDPTSDGSD